MPINTKSQISTDDYWRKHSDVIRRFLQENDRYKQLCSEVEFILKKRIAEAGTEIAHTTSRTKTLNSFLEKLTRKSYENPFEKITDFAGVRVVCLYRSDLPKLEETVTNEFRVIEKIDKLHDMSPNEFGYGAIHYVVRLGKSSQGARYDDLKDLLCEIQLRTVLQDAWAIIDHHLVYKQESDVPSLLQRKLNSLSGLFETADDSFDRIRENRLKYVADVERSANNRDTFLSNEMNRDTFIAYLRWKFPDTPVFPEGLPEQVDMVLRDLGRLKGLKFKTIGDLDHEYEKVKDQADELHSQLMEVNEFPSGCIRLKYGLALLHKELLESPTAAPSYVAVTKKFSANGASNKRLQRTAKNRR